jgi:hypothetical protein
VCSFCALEAHNSSPFDQEPRVTSSRSFQPYSLRWSYSTPVPHGRCRITAIPRRYHRNIKRMKPSQNSRRTKKLFQSSLSCERLRPLTISAIFSFLCLKSSNCYKTERQTPTDSKEPRSSPSCGPRPEIFYFGTSVSQCMLEQCKIGILEQLEIPLTFSTHSVLYRLEGSTAQCVKNARLKFVSQCK